MKVLAVLLFCCLGLAPVARGQSATQTVIIIVEQAHALSRTADRIPLTRTGTTLQGRHSVDGDASYRLTTTGTSKITASSGNGPDLELALDAYAPEGARMAGGTMLSRVAREVATGVTNGALRMKYSAATPARGSGRAEAAVVLLTITG